MIAADQDSTEGATQVAQAAALIARNIRSGQYKPGEKLKIRTLVEETKLGATPLREGLSRLIHRGLVRATDGRGFRVAEVSREDLEDIMRTRLPLEMDALALSIRNGNSKWQAVVVGALHRLVTYASWAPDEPYEAALGFDEVHKAFHLALISACESPRMLEFLDILYDQGFRYRHLMLSKVRPKTLLADPHRNAEHEAMARHAINGDIALAQEVLRNHLETFAPDVFRETSSETRLQTTAVNG